MDIKRLKEFIDFSRFQIYFTDNKITSIGLEIGESTKLKLLGFTRQEQIKFLDWLQDNQEQTKQLLCL